MAELKTVLLIDNLRASPLWSPEDTLQGFEILGVTEATHQAVARAMELRAKGNLAQAMLLLDHPFGNPDPRRRIHRAMLIDPLLGAHQTEKRGGSPNIEDLHPDLRNSIRALLARHSFPSDELGILLEGTAVAEARRRFGPDKGHCSWIAAAAFLLMDENYFDTQERRRRKRKEPVLLEIHASNHGGLHLEHAVEAKFGHCPPQGLSEDRIDLRYTTYPDVKNQGTYCSVPISFKAV